MSKYFKKGNPILVCGQLQTRTWTDTQGNKRYATEVVADEVSFVGSKEASSQGKNEAYTPDVYKTPPKFEPVDVDGDLPF